jgi:phosphatidate cytidylyltransferase
MLRRGRHRRRGVGAAGAGLRRFGWAGAAVAAQPEQDRRRVVGALAGAVLVLTLLGTVTPGLVVAVALGGVLGDLLESMGQAPGRG